MRGSITATIVLGGETATTTQTRTNDGLAGITPTGTPAKAGTLTVRGSTTAGTVTVTTTDITTGDKGVLTWVDALGNLKHRYNVDCTVTEVTTSDSSDSGSGSVGTNTVYTVAVTGGAGDDLPALNSAINISLQVGANITFDFDDMNTFVVTTNVRGVIAFLDATETEKRVIDMDTKGLALWMKASGFPAPITGTPVTHVVFGSGDTSTTSFEPKVLGLYNATYATSGQ